MRRNRIMLHKLTHITVLKRTLLWGAVLLGVPLALALGWVAYLKSTNNFHTVIAGEVYRSAQPSGEDLSKWAASHGIRSVLNLRGASEKDWYKEERAASTRLGLVHADFGMSDRKLLTPERAERVMALIREMPKPILIHCAAGADRSGLISALVLAMNGASEEEAERQISFFYGHVSLPVSAAWPMDQSWEALEPQLGYGATVQLAEQ